MILGIATVSLQYKYRTLFGLKKYFWDNFSIFYFNMKETHYLLSLVNKYARSVNDFETKSGLGSGVIRKIVEDETGRRKLSAKSVQKLSEYFQIEHNLDISEHWLLTGEGAMFLTTADKVKALAQETGKPHGDDKDIQSLKDYLLLKLMKRDVDEFQEMKDKIAEMEKWRDEIREELKKKK